MLGWHLSLQGIPQSHTLQLLSCIASCCCYSCCLLFACQHISFTTYDVTRSEPDRSADKSTQRLTDWQTDTHTFKCSYHFMIAVLLLLQLQLHRGALICVDDFGYYWNCSLGFLNEIGSSDILINSWHYVASPVEKWITNELLLPHVALTSHSVPAAARRSYKLSARSDANCQLI